MSNQETPRLRRACAALAACCVIAGSGAAAAGAAETPAPPSAPGVEKSTQMIQQYQPFAVGDGRKNR